MAKQAEKIRLRAKRRMRVRKKIEGTSERPRLPVFRSPKHVLAQVIDDSTGRTLLSVHSFSKNDPKRANKVMCFDLGKKLAEKCKERSITALVFDKSCYAYHGRVAALADGIRQNGINV